MRHGGSLLVGLLALALAAGDAAAQQHAGDPGTGIHAKDGYDIDALLRRSREQEAAYGRSSPTNIRPEDSRTRSQDRARRQDVDTKRAREAETRQRLQSEQQRQTLDSMSSPGARRSTGEQMMDADRMNRVRNDAERARRESDDAVPNMWRR